MNVKDARHVYQSGSCTVFLRVSQGSAMVSFSSVAGECNPTSHTHASTELLCFRELLKQSSIVNMNSVILVAVLKLGDRR